MSNRFSKSILVMTCLLACGTLQAQTEVYDVVFKQGRVIDPETNLDAIRYVGVNGKKIAIVSETPLKGKVEIDVNDRIISYNYKSDLLAPMLYPCEFYDRLNAF